MHTVIYVMILQKVTYILNKYYSFAAINCTDDPYQVRNDEKGSFDWDLTVRNRSYTHEVKYTYA